MYLDKNTGLTVPGAAPGGGGGSSGEEIPVVTQPAPTVSVNSSNGLVTAAYTPVAGKVEDTAKKSGTLQLTTQAAQTITPGTSNKTIASGRFLTGTQTIKGDSNLTAGNIKSGVSIFGVAGSYEATAAPVVPDTCIAYLGSNNKLYVKQGSGITVGGLTKQSTSDRAGWDAYSGFTAGTIPGSVLSKDGVYLQWSGFNDLSKKWSIHSLMNSGYREDSGVWRVGWGFDRVDDQYGDWDSTLGYGTDVMGFRCMAYFHKPQKDNSGISSEWEFPDGRAGRGISPVHCASYGLSWDGNGQTADSKLYYYGDHYLPTNNSGHQKLYEPPYYDEMMGGYMGNAYRYSLGDKLYLGKPAKCEVGEAQSGVMILQFALELASYGSGDYYSPFFTGVYKNL